MTEQEMMAKLRDMAGMFSFHFERKEYWQAVLVKTQAQHIALFIELDDLQMQELFGDGGYRKGREEENLGLFNAAKAEKAVLHSCIKGDHDIQKMAYGEVMEIWKGGGTYEGKALEGV